MNRVIVSTLLATLAIAPFAGIARAQSTTSDPLGINAMDDTSVARQRGALQGGTNSSLGMMPDSYRNEDTVSSWSFDGGDIILHQKSNQE